MLTKKNYRLFNFAKNISDMSDFKRVKVGCILSYGNKIIGSGFNCEKTHPLQEIYNTERFEGGEAKLHAEIHALIPLIKKDVDWKNVSLYTYRGMRNHDNVVYTTGMSRPCKSCMKLIKELGIKNIYYTTDGGYAYERVM